MNDEQYMRVALELAKQALPSPNPRVGCIIVKDSKIIASGHHKKAGEAHAEINALARIKPQDCEGAAMYVTLEPCSHEGKRTGPCTKAIIASGIKHVVCAMKDPNPKVKGIEELRKHGIKVEVGVLEKEAEKLNEAYAKHIAKNMPFVILKAGITLDGKIATASGESKWITCEESRNFEHKLREETDGIMVGIGTVLKDNPRLTARKGDKELARHPVKIIVDSKLRIKTSARLFDGNIDENKVIVATSGKCNKARLKAIKKKAEIVICGADKVDLKKLMRVLANKGITSIMLEGGSSLNGGMIREKLVDKILFFIAPKIIGGIDSVPVIGGMGIPKLKKAIKVRNMSANRVGDDILVEGYLEYG